MWYHDVIYGYIRALLQEFQEVLMHYSLQKTNITTENKPFEDAFPSEIGDLPLLR